MDIPSTHLSGDSPRDYHCVTLDNGLRCCLISDPSSDKAAAAVCVMAGQLHDSASCHGIAHLTEHMLFMGSVPFPGENEYDQYIQQSGGHSNAYTDLEQTVYYFDVSSVAKFKGGLERLCGALSQPLIASSSLERELQAVDAEHSKNVTNDHWRTHQLTRMLLGKNNEHPYSNFGTGNKISLLNQTGIETTVAAIATTGTDDATPKESPDPAPSDAEVAATDAVPSANEEAYETLRREILAFYKQYYVASNMTLAVLGPQSISELQSMVQEIFMQLPTLNANEDCKDSGNISSSGGDITNTVPRLPLRDDVTVVQWIPLSGGDNSASLELQWIVDDYDTTTEPNALSSQSQWYQYQSKPAHVWSHLLGHEGPGSLLAALRDLQWAHDLSADDSSGNTRSFSLFTVHITLTMEGLAHVVDVLHMIFYYIDTVLGAGSAIPCWVYDELKVTGDTAFNFLARRDAAMTVSSLSAHMHQYTNSGSGDGDTEKTGDKTGAHYLSGPYRIWEHNGLASQRIGQSLSGSSSKRGRNLVVLIGSATEYANVTDAVDQWYGTQYRIVPNNDDDTSSNIWKQLLDRLDGTSTTESLPEWASMLYLPAQNDMLPTDFSLVSDMDEDVAAAAVLAPWKVQSDHVANGATASSEDILEPTTQSSSSPANKAGDADTDTLSASTVPLRPPRCLLDTPTCRLWYKPDLTYQTPKVNFIASLRSPVVQNALSPETAVLSSLWVHVATELCNDFAYAASMAGLHCGFSESANGSMELSVSGYNHKTGILLQRICDTLTTKLPAALSTETMGDADGTGPNTTSSSFFERIRNKLEQQYESALASAPYMHGSMVADLVLEASNRGSIHQRLAYLTNKDLLTSNTLLHFSNQLLSCFHLEVLVHGNVLPETARTWTSIILEAFTPAPVLRLHPSRGVQLPACVSGDKAHSECIYRLKGWNEHDENSCVVNIYQVGLVDIVTNAKMSLLLQLLREPAFNILRTEEQLGYIVFTSLKTSANNVKSVMFLIQSDSFDPVHVDARIESFLNVFRSKVMVEMTDEDFQANVDSFCDSILEKDKNLGEESSKYWNVINNQTYQFRRLHQIAQAARCLTKLDILRFFDHFVLAKSPYRRKLSIQLFGTASEPKRLELLNSTAGAEDVAADPLLIQCPDEFVRLQALFPAQQQGCIKDLLLPVTEEPVE